MQGRLTYNHLFKRTEKLELIRPLNASPAQRGSAARYVDNMIDDAMCAVRRQFSKPTKTERDKAIGDIAAQAEKLAASIESLPPEHSREIWDVGRHELWRELGPSIDRIGIYEGESPLEPTETLDYLSYVLKDLSSHARKATLAARPQDKRMLTTAVYGALHVFHRFRPQDISAYQGGVFANYANTVMRQVMAKADEHMEVRIPPSYLKSDADFSARAQAAVQIWRSRDTISSK